MPLKIGKYIIKQTIGSGSFAEVKLAVHEETRKKYAIKIFDRQKMSLEEFENDVKKEVKIMQYLRHPNIVSVEQVMMSGNNMYIVMELVEGGELYYEIVKRKRLPEEQARGYFHQLVDAMAYCHRKGVYHRDLKPENLLINEEGVLKITDFGMSRMKENMDQSDELLHTQCGTPKYMAPEIIVRAKQGYKGDKLDVWDCGMILFAMCAGYLPFNGADDRAVFRQIVFGKLKFPAWFSDELQSLLRKLLEKDPARRPTLTELYEDEWFAVNYTGPGSRVGDENSERSTHKSRHEQRQKNAHTDLSVVHSRNLKTNATGATDYSGRVRSRSRSSARSDQRTRSNSRDNRARSRSRATDHIERDKKKLEAIKAQLTEDIKDSSKSTSISADAVGVGVSVGGYDDNGEPNTEDDNKRHDDTREPRSSDERQRSESPRRASRRTRGNRTSGRLVNVADSGNGRDDQRSPTSDSADGESAFPSARETSESPTARRGAEKIVMSPSKKKLLLKISSHGGGVDPQSSSKLMMKIPSVGHGVDKSAARPPAGGGALSPMSKKTPPKMGSGAKKSPLDDKKQHRVGMQSLASFLSPRGSKASDLTTTGDEDGSGDVEQRATPHRRQSDMSAFASILKHKSSVVDYPSTRVMSSKLGNVAVSSSGGGETDDLPERLADMKMTQNQAGTKGGVRKMLKKLGHYKDP